MKSITLPRPTTANERLLTGREPIPPSFFIVDSLAASGWLYDGANLYQPIFGLTAKTIDGPERTVVEGDVVVFRPDGMGVIMSGDFGVIAWRDYAFVIHWANDEPTPVVDVDVLDFTILCHCTDIIAAGDKIKCWDCGGYGLGPEIANGPNDPIQEPCPTCEGAGQINVNWKE